MTRTETPSTRFAIGVPRASGDDPSKVTGKYAPRVCSPRERG